MSATSSGRRRRAGAARTMAQIMELQWLAPAVMSRRLAGLHNVSPLQALFEWNRWAVEKACAFSLSGMALTQVCARAAMAGAARGKHTPAASMRDALERGPAATSKALAPLHKRVKRNARRGR